MDRLVKERLEQIVENRSILSKKINVDSEKDKALWKCYSDLRLKLKSVSQPMKFVWQHRVEELVTVSYPA